MGILITQKEARQSLLSTDTPERRQSPARRTLNISLQLFSTLGIIGLLLHTAPFTSNIFSHPKLETCAWKSFQPHVSLLDVPSIAREEFLDRQSTLAAALAAAGVDAFIMEPSASSSYFANISASYELSERPFLAIIDRYAQFSYLVPKFEAGRISKLDMVFSSKGVIEWRDEQSPYRVLKEVTGYQKIMLDERARFMIASGLRDAGIDVVETSQTIQSIRAVKTEAELAILRGINEFTLQLVRSLQKCIKIGMDQHTVVSAARSLFARAGVGEGFWAVVLFGDQAANPHGGSVGRTLSDGEFVLIDIGSSLHGYGSDVTRTFLPSSSKISRELMDIWQTVFAAQTAAIERMNVNESCSAVDAAARSVIRAKGYEEFFTHRLGHGLGLEMHEHPYLNGANHEKLKEGEVVTNEPVRKPGTPHRVYAKLQQGIYVTSEQAKKLDQAVGFGVRIEDAVLVTKDGGVVMTGSRAKSPYHP